MGSIWIRHFRIYLILAVVAVVASTLIAWWSQNSRLCVPPILTETSAVEFGESTLQRDADQRKLAARVPGVQVDFDGVLGLPKSIRSVNGFLTGPGGTGGAVGLGTASSIGTDDSLRSVKTFLNEYSALFGINADAISKADTQRDYVNAHNGMRTLAWSQTIDGVPVYGGQLLANVSSKGELVNIGSQFIPHAGEIAELSAPGHLALQDAPPLGSDEALRRALDAFKPVSQPVVKKSSKPQGAAKAHTLTSNATLGETYATLSWVPLSRTELHLAWDLTFTERSSNDMYNVLLDVKTGQTLKKVCLTSTFISKELSREIAAQKLVKNGTGRGAYSKSLDLSGAQTTSAQVRSLQVNLANSRSFNFGDQPASYRVYTGDSPSPFSPGWPTSQSGQPSLVNRSFETLISLNSTASPNGWIDDDVNETRGNNVDAHLDANDDDQPDAPRPQGSPFRVFDFSIDLTKEPNSYSRVSVTQLFYWCNFAHDKMYELGFTEAAGNFQNNNFGRGGAGSDAIQADAQDGGDTNNANFSSPRDGQPGRMQMYLWDASTPIRDCSLDGTIIIHEYAHGLSNRLVGGGVQITDLQAQGLGEGWSDFYALALLSSDGEDINGNYAVGSYAIFGLSSDNYYRGIRRYPYTTDITKNPLTFNNIITNTEVHRQGEVWCVALWDARAKLVTRYGWATGNQLILQLVTDGMKLAPANPNFLQARDAILLADRVNNGGANQKDLWQAFAKRGMGLSAISPDSSTTTGVVEAFDFPEDLYTTPLTGFICGGDPAGPFNPSSKIYTFRSFSDVSIDWTASKTQPWLIVSPSSGVLAPYATASITVSLNNAADILPLNSYSDTLTITNTTNGNGNTTRPVRLTISKNYVTQSVSYNWIDPTGHTPVTFSPDADDGSSGAQTIPFSFQFYGNAYTQLYVGTNGLIGFTNSKLDAFANTDLPNETGPVNILCPLWDDLDPSKIGASVKIGTVGSAPNRKLVITYNNVPVINGGNPGQPVTFQAILLETSNDIIFQYKDIIPGLAGYGGGRAATVGVQNLSGSVAKTYSYNGSRLLTNSLALLFTLNVTLPRVSLSADAFTVGEADETANITINLSTASALLVTLNYATSNGTASAGSDYTQKSGVLVFNPGETSKAITVPITKDAVDERDETFTLSIINPENANLGTINSATVTLIDDDLASTLSFSAEDYALNEQSGSIDITVNLDVPSGKTISVNYSTANGTATVGSDYTSSRGKLTFDPGETSKTFNVPVTNDVLDEDNETIKLELVNAINASPGEISNAIVTLADDDAVPSVTLSAALYVLNENAGSAVITVNLGKASGRSVSVNYATASGTAIADGDYAASSGTLTFNPTEISKTITVPIENDLSDEEDEAFTLTLSSAVNAALGTIIVATVSITDDDVVPAVSFSTEIYSINETVGGAEITVNLNVSSGKTVSVNYASANGTAKAGSDYAAVSGTLLFLPGETAKTITVPIVNDSVDEDDKSFTLTLSNPVNAALGTLSGAIATLADDDSAPAASFSSAAYSRYESGVSVAVMVNLIGLSDRIVSVEIATADGTATAGNEYTARSEMLTFNPGESSKIFVVQLANDTTPESARFFMLALSTPVNGTLGVPGSTTVTIVDDDTEPKVSLSAASYSLNENAGDVLITANLTAPYEKSVSVNYATVDGTAKAGSDYTVGNGTLIFNPGETRQTLTVPLTNDTTHENDEVFTLALSSPVNATVDAPSSTTVTITDDDLVPPEITSGPTATPNPAVMGQPVQFACAVTSEQTITWTWVFGDGVSAGEQAPIHRYSAAGTYTVGVTATNAQGASTAKSLILQVNTAGAGSGGSPESITLTKFTASLGLISGGHDGLQLSGILDLPAGFNTANVPVIFDLGGMQQTFVLDSKGKAKSGRNSIALKLKLTQKKFLGGPVSFQIRVSGGSWSSAWIDEGPQVMANVYPRPLPLTMSLILGTKPFAGTVHGLLYVDKKGTKAKVKL